MTITHSLARARRDTARSSLKQQQSTAETPAKIVRIAVLKEWMAQNFSRDSKLRELILSERDILRPDEFISKLESWLLLAMNEGA